MRDFTVIIPTWNMGSFLKPLTDSILQSPFAEIVEEILFVCEKSSDGSEKVIADLRAQQGDRKPTIRMIQPEQRKNLFVARYLGATGAKTKKIFFIDSRLTLPQSSGQALLELSKKYPAMCANADIDVTKSIFSLYWQRSHEAIFRRSYKAKKGVLTVTSENFDQYRIGGTCFYCSRELFIKESEKYLHSPILSDDTMLMRDMVRTEPISVDPDFRVWWEPRDKWKPFLKHLYTRGPGFVEYHFFESRGWLFYAVLFAMLFMIAEVLLLFVNPLLAIELALGVFALLVLSTALLARSVGEFFRLAPLHIGVIFAYGFGAIRGTWIIWKKRRLANKNNPAAHALKSNLN